MSSHRRLPPPEIAAAVVLIGAVVVALVVMLTAGLLEADEVASSTDPRSSGAPVAAAPDGTPRTPAAVVLRRTELRASPRGRRVAAVGPKTEFGSPRVLAVVDERAGWLRVMDAELRNGQRAWIEARDVERGAVDYGLRVDLSARRLDVMRAGRVIRRVRTAVGEQGTPTPTGRFAVTDRVPFTDPESPYGCCALALTAHQPNTPSSWTGGDRIAIHATPAASSIGRPVTLGCMRVPARDARWLMGRIPLGTPVSIRA